MTSLRKDKSEINVTPQSETPAVAPSTQLAPIPEKPKIGGVSGEVDSSDIKRPFLQIVHGTSKAADNFPPGSLVLNGDTLLSHKGETPVKLTVLYFKKYFLELIPFDSEGPRPRTFETLAEVKAAGLHTEWIGDKRPPAFPVGDALVAIESEKEDPLFPLEFNGKYYSIAMWKLQSSSAFNRAGKMIITAADFGLKDGLHKGSWTLTTRMEKLGPKMTPVPVLKTGPKNPDDLVAFFEALI